MVGLRCNLLYFIESLTFHIHTGRAIGGVIVARWREGWSRGGRRELGRGGVKGSEGRKLGGKVEGEKEWRRFNGEKEWKDVKGKKKWKEVEGQKEWKEVEGETEWKEVEGQKKWKEVEGEGEG